MRRLLVLTALVACILTAAAQQRWLVGAGYDFYFDNLEAAGCEIDESGTIFGARLKPYVGWEFDKRNRLTFGVSLLQNFGEEVKFVSDAKPMFYYTYSGKAWKANAGIFPRTEMQGTYGEHIYAGSLNFTNDLLYGLSAAYRSDAALWEGVVSWDGMYSTARRELFRIYSSGQYVPASNFHLGYNFKLTHLANSQGGDEGVVDYIVIDPYIGTTFTAWADWTMRAHAVMSVQRDRKTGDSEFPVGGQLDIALSKWGFTLHNELYLGQNQMSFYGRYGKLLYLANENYGTRHHVYNHSGLDYNRSLFKGRVDVGASFEVHYGGAGVSLQQVLSLKLNIEKMWKIK